MADLIVPLIIFSQNLVTSLGYPGIFFIAFLENFFPPLPSELIFPFVGFVVGTGRLDFFGVILAGSLGALAGAVFWYGVGYLLGRANLKNLVGHYGHPFHLKFKDVERAEAWFARYEAPAVFFGRLFPLVRTLISIPAGFVRMPVHLFIAYSFLGIFFWVTALTFGGYILGEHWEEIVPLIESYELVAKVLLLVVIAIFLIRIFAPKSQK